MQLTSAEKLILMMLCQISEKVEAAGDIDHRFVEMVIANNADWALPWKYPTLNEPSRTKEEVNFVVDVLQMARVIEDGYRALDANEQTMVDSAVAGDHEVYGGFDGNAESEYRAIADFLVHELGRFEEFVGRDSDAHGPMVSIYERKLDVFKRSVRASFQKISPELIIAVLKA